jgi:intracellular multiplication protein IcmC
MKQNFANNRFADISQLAACMLALLCLLYAPPVPALTVDLGQMIKNLNTAVPEFMRLVTGISYVTGFFLFFKMFYQMKRYGEMRTMMASQTDLRGPLMLMVAGAMLIYLPTGVGVTIETFWDEPTVMAYDASGDKWAPLMKSVVGIVQVVGVISFIRGWTLMTKAAGQGAQPGTLGRAVSHIVGGALAINVVGFISAIQTTLGIAV